MRDVGCDLCGSRVATLFAQRPPRADVLHRTFVRCAGCALVYARPRATAEEAERFYAAVEDRGSGALGEPVGGAAWRRAVDDRRRRLESAAALVRPADGAHRFRFLDLGFGDASALVAARALGWEPYGLEYAGWLVDAATSRLGLENVAAGDLIDARFPEGHFDVVHAWHVVEHVLDVNAWLAELARVLRPGGVVVLGTESSESLQGRLWRLAFRLARRTPWPPTSTDHTYWFSRDSLVALVRRHELDPCEARVYENAPVSVLRDTPRGALRRPRSLAAHALYLAGSVASAVAPSLGGKLVVVARRR